MSPAVDAFGECLRKLRTRSKMTAAQLSAAILHHANYVDGWERNAARSTCASFSGYARFWRNRRAAPQAHTLSVDRELELVKR